MHSGESIRYSRHIRLSRVEGYFTVISEPGSGEKAVDAIRHGMEPCGYDISVETHDMASGKDALLADAPPKGRASKGYPEHRLGLERR